jgi:nucleotide-binding universal stress UspA family protein
MITRKILCAHDLTHASAPALRLAIELARQLDVGVFVLHVAEPPYPRKSLFGNYSADELEVLTGVAQREQIAALRILQDQIASFNPPGKDAAEVDTMVRQGVPADVIVTVARELATDLLVVGTHARTGMQHLLIGSVAERLVRTAPCPVLVARGDDGKA